MCCSKQLLHKQHGLYYWAFEHYHMKDIPNLNNLYNNTCFNIHHILEKIIFHLESYDSMIIGGKLVVFFVFQME